VEAVSILSVYLIGLLLILLTSVSGIYILAAFRFQAFKEPYSVFPVLIGYIFLSFLGIVGIVGVNTIFLPMSLVTLFILWWIRRSQPEASFNPHCS
jgi:hypothetical protein